MIWSKVVFLNLKDSNINLKPYKLSYKSEIKTLTNDDLAQSGFEQPDLSEYGFILCLF